MVATLLCHRTPRPPQLAAYAYALETLTGQKVTRRILWFLGPNTGVTLGE